MDKPQFLYHGSCRGINGPLSPRPQHGDINEFFPDGIRHVVFATHDQNLAAIYTLKNEYMMSAGVTEGRNFAIFRDYDSWKDSIDQSACNVYALSPDTFTQTLGKMDGQPSIEWQSPAAVMPDHIIHQTPESVMQTGSQLFFLDPAITDKMWHYDPSKPDDYSFLNRIDAKHRAGVLPADFSPMDYVSSLIDAGVMRHLNIETGIQPLTLEKSPYGDLIREDVSWLKQQMLSTPERADGKAWSAALGARTGFAASKV